jgi:hypothetical protein
VIAKIHLSLPDPALRLLVVGDQLLNSHCLNLPQFHPSFLVPPLVRKLLLPLLSQSKCAAHFVNLQASSVSTFYFVCQQSNSLEFDIILRFDYLLLSVIYCANIVYLSIHIVTRRPFHRISRGPNTDPLRPVEHDQEE